MHPTNGEQAFTPVSILLISFAMRIQDPSQRLLLIVLTISFGVSLASYGELRFNLVGMYALLSLSIAVSDSRR
jgi:hypothetical protein